MALTLWIGLPTLVYEFIFWVHLTWALPCAKHFIYESPSAYSATTLITSSTKKYIETHTNYIHWVPNMLGIAAGEFHVILFNPANCLEVVSLCFQMEKIKFDLLSLFHISALSTLLHSSIMLE